MKYIDMHCDTISEIWYSRLRKENQTLRKNNFMIRKFDTPKSPRALKALFF